MIGWTFGRLNDWKFERHVLLSWVHILTVNGRRKLLKTPNTKVLFITISENSLLQTHLQKIDHQCHHQQILRFRHHLVRTLLIICIIIWYKPFASNNIWARINLSHNRGCKPVSCPNTGTKNLSLGFSVYLTLPLQHLSVALSDSASLRKLYLLSVWVSKPEQNSFFFVG